MMKTNFLKKLTPKELKKHKQFIEEYDRKEQERATPIENPLTGDALRKIAEDKKEEPRPYERGGPK